MKRSDQWCVDGTEGLGEGDDIKDNTTEKEERLINTTLRAYIKVLF